MCWIGLEHPCYSEEKKKSAVVVVVVVVLLFYGLATSNISLLNIMLLNVAGPAYIIGLYRLLQENRVTRYCVGHSASFRAAWQSNDRQRDRCN